MNYDAFELIATRRQFVIAVKSMVFIFIKETMLWKKGDNLSLSPSFFQNIVIIKKNPKFPRGLIKNAVEKKRTCRTKYHDGDWCFRLMEVKVFLIDKNYFSIDFQVMQYNIAYNIYLLIIVYYGYT